MAISYKRLFKLMIDRDKEKRFKTEHRTQLYNDFQT